MSVVTAVEPKGEKAAILVMDDGTRVWTPEKAKADELVGKPIPGDWTQKVGDYGPQAFPPRPRSGGGGGGGAAAWRNTKEGAWFEAVARAVNTAVMQAKDPAEADVWLAWSVANLQKLTSGDCASANRPSTGSPPAPPSIPPPGGGAPRPSGGGGPAKVDGKQPKPQPPSPTGQSDDDNPWAGMKEFA